MISASRLARKIGSGVHGRLEFDFACNRGHGFGEAYLHGVLIELLASNVYPELDNILPSYAVPTLQRTDRTAGRKREVDVAVRSRTEGAGLSLCLEAKWAGSSHANADNVLGDVARLALISSENTDVACLFVLAGGKNGVRNLLSSGVLDGGPQNHGLLRFPYDENQTYRYHLTAGTSHKADLPEAKLELLYKKLPAVPDSVNSFLYKPTHANPPDWHVYVWRVGI